MALSPEQSQRLAGLERRLDAGNSPDEFVSVICAEICEAMGYSVAWMAVYEPGLKMARMLGLHGDEELEKHMWRFAPVIPVVGDPYMERILNSSTVEVLEDASTDPDVNREIVERLGTRTIVTAPLRSNGNNFGVVGTGTFGDEGVRMPTPEQLAYLQAVAIMAGGLVGSLVSARPEIA